MRRPLLRPVAAPPPTVPDLHLDLDPAELATDLDRGWSAQHRSGLARPAGGERQAGGERAGTDDHSGPRVPRTASRSRELQPSAGEGRPVVAAYALPPDEAGGAGAALAPSTG